MYIAVKIALTTVRHDTVFHIADEVNAVSHRAEVSVILIASLLFVYNIEDFIFSEFF